MSAARPRRRVRDDTADLVADVCAYTKRERASESGSVCGEPDMVALWLRICRTAARIRRASEKPAPLAGAARRRRK